MGSGDDGGGHDGNLSKIPKFFSGYIHSKEIHADIKRTILFTC